MKLPLNQIICGDALKVLKELPAESIDCCITSPPYWGLRDYGTAKWEGGNPKCEHKVGRATRGGLTKFQANNKGSFGDEAIKQGESCPHCGAVRVDAQLGLEKTPEEYVAKMVEVFREVKRVLKKEGNCWLNLGDTYSGTGAGQEKSPQAQGKQTDGQFFENVKSRELKAEYKGLPSKNLIGIPWRVAFALQQDGWYLRQDIIWAKPNPMPESVTDRCTKSHEYVFLLAKSPKYYFNNEAIREKAKTEPHARGKILKQDDTGKQSSQNVTDPTALFSPDGNRNRRSVWTITTKPFKEAHFATFPEDLIVPMALAGCPKEICNRCGKARERILEPTEEYKKFLGKSWHDHKHDLTMGFGQQTRGFSKRKGNVSGIKRYKDGYIDCGCNAGFSAGIVLDPFIGAGTTAVVAKKLGRNYLGIDLNPKYVKMAEARIKAVPQSLF